VSLPSEHGYTNKELKMNRQELGAIEDEMIEIATKINELEARRRELREAYAQGHAELHGYSVGSTVRYKDSKKVVKEGVVAFVRAHHAYDFDYEVIADTATGERLWLKATSKNLWPVRSA
jgi:hypothetical protein